MPPAPANATPCPEHILQYPAQVLAAYRAHQGMTGRGNSSFTYHAKVFLRRWPQVRAWQAEPLGVQLSANSGTRPFITFLLVTGRLHPGWEYLVHRKFSAIWRDLPGTLIGADVQEFITAARRAGYTERVASAMASQVTARVLFATGKRLTELTHDDFDALAAAGLAREHATGPPGSTTGPPPPPPRPCRPTCRSFRRCPCRGSSASPSPAASVGCPSRCTRSCPIPGAQVGDL